MSVALDLSELRAKIEEFGAVAYLVTVGADGSPHTVSVTVGWRDDSLVVGAGRRTAENAGGRPTVTLLWSPPAGAPYCLIVDGAATPLPDEESLSIRPEGAVLHRVAGADAGLPSCVKVLQAPV